MQFFISYARRNLKYDYPNSLARFLEVLRMELDDEIGEVAFWRDEQRLHEQHEWREELAVEIARSDAFVVLFSKEWLRSKICWLEYERALESPHLGRKRIIPIVLKTDGLETVIVPERFAARRDDLVQKFLKDLHQTDFTNGYGPRFADIHNLGARGDGQMAPLVAPLVAGIKQRLGDTPKPENYLGPLGQVPKVKKTMLRVGSAEIAFCDVPSGGYICPTIGVQRDIGSPFKIMTEAMPVADIWGQGATRSTYKDLVTPGKLLPRGFSLALEREWEWAIGGGSAKPAFPLANTENGLGLSLPTPGEYEATGSWDGAPHAKDIPAEPGQHLVGKTITTDGFGKKRIQFAKRLGNARIRLVFRG